MLIVAVGFDQFQRERIARGLDGPGSQPEPTPSSRLPEGEPSRVDVPLGTAHQAKGHQEEVR
jgi:hypothetical protein